MIGASSRPSTSAAHSLSLIPLGHEATPSFHAASIMFWAQRPMSIGRSPATATTSDAPRTLSGA